MRWYFEFLFAALISIAALPLGPALAKIPGEVHCYHQTCRRVLSIDETKGLVGSTRILVASYYDDPRIDPSNTGLLTSSGEKFDAGNAARLASSLYPDGTELLLWNPDNGRAAHVRVNDFGPFHSNRTLDLTRALAERLKITRRGVTRLHVTVVAQPGAAEARYRRWRIYPRTKGYLGVYEQAALPALAKELTEESQTRIVAAGAPSRVAARIPLPERKPPPRLRPRDLIRALTNPPPVLASLAPVDAPSAVEPPLALDSDVVPVLLAVAEVEPPRRAAEIHIERLMFAGTLGSAPAKSTLDLLLYLTAASIGMLILHRVHRAGGTARAISTVAGERNPSGATPTLALVPEQPRTEPRPSSSFVDAGVEVSGSLVSRSTLHIAGTFRGDCVSSRIVVEPTGRLIGNAVAEEIVINGYVEGSIIAKAVTLRKLGGIVGNVEYCDLVMEPQATLEATVQRISRDYWADDALAAAA